MSYVVNWQGPDGSPGWYTVAELTDAAAYVERLRNTEGVEGAKIYRLEEVVFELKPYFRVELATPTVVTEPARGVPVHADESWVESEWVDAGSTAAEPDDSVTDVPVVASVLESTGDGANGVQRRGLFGR